MSENMEDMVEDKQIVLYTKQQLVERQKEELSNWDKYKLSLSAENKILDELTKKTKDQLGRELHANLQSLLRAHAALRKDYENKELLTQALLEQSLVKEDKLAIEASPEQIIEQQKKIEELMNEKNELTNQYNNQAQQLINNNMELTNQYNNQAQQLIDKNKLLESQVEQLDKKYEDKVVEFQNMVMNLELGDEEKASTMKKQIEKLENEKKTLKQKLTTNVENLSASKAANRNNEKKVKELGEMVIELKKTIENKTLLITQSTIADKEKDSTISKLMQDKEKLQREKDTLDLNLANAKQELSESRNREQTTSVEASDLGDQIKKLGKEIEALTSGSESKLKDLATERNEKIADLNQEITQLKENVATLTRERNELIDVKNVIQSSLDTLTNTLKTSEITASEALEMNVRLQEKINSSEGILSSNIDMIKSLEGTKAELEEKVRALTVEIDLAKNATVSERQRADNSENALTVATEQLSTLKEQAEEMKRGIEDQSGLPAQLQRANEEYNRLNEAYNKLESRSNETEKERNNLEEEKEKLSERLEEALNNTSLSDPIVDDSYSQRVLANVRLWELRDGDVTDFFEMDAGSFSPDVHKKLLLFDERERDIIATALIASRQFKTLPVYDARAKEYTSQLYEIVDDFDDDDSETGVKKYAAILKTDIVTLTTTYGKIVDGEDTLITSKSKKKTPDTGVKEDLPFVFGASVFALNMIDTMNQVVWQSKVNELNEAMPGSFTVEMRFSKGLNPRVGTKEFHFVARNVHLIKDPTGVSDDVFYVINLANAASLENMYYIQLGSLVMNSIYGLGSFSYRILANDSKLVKGDLIKEYSFPEDAKHEYNTKVMLHPKDDVTFYARDTKNNTYHLETILIKA